MKKACHKNSAFLSAFTLLEVMIVTALFGLVVAGTIEVYIMCQRAWHATSLSMDTSRMASLAIQRMVYGFGTNGGLRSAASISVNTNVHKDGCSLFLNYWDTTTNSPPAANNSSYNTFCPYNIDNDGSWRIVMSNAFDGLKWIDYVKQQRSIVFWQNTNQPASRVSVCNYVINSTVSNTLEGIAIELTVWKKDGMFVASNQVSTFVKMRNKF
ncbi:MAG: type II secretion system protein [Kiritimatiellia bacterium]|nr:type II secretion system protein [Kiritimatiellia bacterium]